MAVKLSLLGYTPDGFKCSASAEGKTMTDALADYASIQEFAKTEGWVADGMGLAATKTFGGATTHETRIRVDGKPDEGGIRCRIDGREVEPFSGYGKSYTAQELADSRSKKMVELGEPAGPVCGDCWTGGGFKARAEAAFKQRQASRR